MESEERKQKNGCAGLLLLEKVNYPSCYPCDGYLACPFLLADAPNANILIARRLTSPVFLSPEPKWHLPKQLLLPKCGIGTKSLNLRCTLYIKPPFPPSSKSMPQSLFVWSKSYVTIAFSYENSSLGLSVWLNPQHVDHYDAQHAQLHARVYSFLRCNLILAGIFLTESHSAAMVTNPLREERSGVIPKLQPIIHFFPGAGTSVWKLQSWLHVFTRSAAHTVCWCFPGSCADVTRVRIGSSTPNLLISTTHTCSGSFPLRSEPSSSKIFCRE